MIVFRCGIILRSCDLDRSVLLLQGASSHRKGVNYRGSCLIVELADESLLVFKITSHPTGKLLTLVMEVSPRLRYSCPLCNEDIGTKLLS